MEFRVLGKLEVFRDGEAVNLGSFRQRSLLALLLCAPNSVLSTDQIIDSLWGDDGGPDKQNALWVYVSGIRKALEPDRPKRTDGTVLLTRSPGYLAEVDPDSVDSLRFERLVVEGRALIDTDPAAAAIVLGEALSLWRGRAFEEFTYESFAQIEIGRLEELRVEAVAARIEADLRCGRSRELVSELETLVKQHPHREEFSGQLMLALARSGRQAEALRVFTDLRARLVEELGVDPGPAVTRIHDEVLAGMDTSISGGLSGEVSPSAGLAIRGYELREKLAETESWVSFSAYQPAVGREVVIKVCRPARANDPDFIRRFEAEAKQVAQLEHPHIVPLYDFWREPNAAYLVTRRVGGGSLADVIESSALTPADSVGVLEQIGSALSLAHRSGVVHHDISPANVLFDVEGNAYVSDFAIGDADSGSSSAADVDLDISDLGSAIAQALTGLSGEAEQIRGALPATARAVIDRATIAEPGDRYSDVSSFVHDFRVAVGPPSVSLELPIAADTPNPYKGLRSFGGPDASDFFGRERLVERLLAALGQPGLGGRFVAVVGPSGSGKSSVVRAGVLPALRRDALPGSSDWFNVEMTPAPHPFESLEEALLAVAVSPPPSLIDVLVGSEHGIDRAVRAALPDDGSQLLLAIDQFEELFTQVDQATSLQFIDSLVDAVTAKHSRVRVVVTLRADFYDRPLGHARLGELLRDGTQVITAMNAEQLERAVAGPVEQFAITYEPSLIAQLVTDVADRPGALPLLQYALTELFSQRKGNQITSADYAELGGVSCVLSKRAEGLLAALPAGAHDVARQVFLRLVTVGVDADDTRRRVLQSELEALQVDRSILDSVLASFGRRRLISFDRDPVTRSPTVEISHEALLSEWDRLAGWIDAARSDLVNQRRLAEALAEWNASDRRADFLLSGGRLDELHGWSTDSAMMLSAPEADFLQKSLAARHNAIEAERQQEKITAEAIRNEGQRRKQLVGVGLVAALVSALAIFGIFQWRTASSERANAEASAQMEETARRVADNDRERLQIVNQSNELVTLSNVALATGDPDLALAYAVEALRISVNNPLTFDQSLDATHWALQALGAQYDVGPDVQVVVRPGPAGLTGVFVIPADEMIELAERTSDRRLTDSECEAVFGDGCQTVEPLPAGASGYRETTGVGPIASDVLAGTSVTVSQFSIEVDPALEAEFEAFTDATGIKVDLQESTSANDLDRFLSGEIARPDVAVIGGPVQWTQELALDLGTFLDHGTLRSDFGDYALNLGALRPGTAVAEINEVATSIPINASFDSLVYYPKGAFDAAGYKVPESLEELYELSQQMVADGHTPWCFSFKSGYPFNGWPGTNLMESLVLRFGGVETYDAWMAGELSSTSPSIAEAGRYGDSLLFGEGFVRNGSASITANEFPADMLFLLNRDAVTNEVDPQCWLLHQADFMYGTVPPGNTPGVDLDHFILPPVTAGEQAPTKAALSTATALTDRPEIRVFMEYLASPEFGTTWAAQPNSRFVPVNRRFDGSAFGPAGDVVADSRRGTAEWLAQAINSDAMRVDASDHMPPEIGGITEDGAPGVFYQGMVDWADGVRTIDEVLAAMDAAWEEWRLANPLGDEGPIPDEAGSPDTGSDVGSSPVDDGPVEPPVPLGPDGVYAVEEFPAGPQAPGTYRSDILGTPITVTLEGSWISPHSIPGHTVFIDPESLSVGDRDVTFLRPYVLADPTDPGAAPAPGVLRPAENIEEWLDTLVDGIVTGGPETVVIGGREAVYFEAQITNTEVCGTFLWCAGFIANTVDEQGNISGWSFDPGTRQRVWWIDQGDEQPLVIIAATRSGDTGFETRADELLDSLIIGDPQPHPVSRADSGLSQ